MQIVPGILTDDMEVLKIRLEKCIGRAEWVQIDFIDGEYADNRTIKPVALRFMIEDLRKNNLKLEAHLMVNKRNFKIWMEEALAVGFERMMPQVESLDISQKEFVKWIHSVNRQPALSIDAETPLEILDNEVLNELEVVQVMTIKAGFSGQKLIPELLDKVRQLSVVRSKLSAKFLIEVDGGVNVETIQQVQAAGADLAEVNSGLFNSGDFEENLQTLRRKIMI